MSPVERSSGHAGRALAVSGVAIALVGLGLWGASVFASRQPSLEVGLGDQTFRAGRVSRIARTIAEDGPILYTDVSGSRDRDLILQHLGDDPDEGWHAFRAQPPDRDRACTWQWQADEDLFRAACDPDLTAPADGAGLERYPVTVEDGELDIDLNADQRPRPPTTTGPRSTVIESGNVPTTGG